MLRLILGFFALSFFDVSLVQANDLFRDNFETSLVGNVPIGWSGGGGLVTTAQAVDGNNSVYLSGTPNSGRSITLSLPEINTPKAYEFSYSMLVDENSWVGNDGDAKASIYAGGYFTNLGIRKVSGQYKLLIEGNPVETIDLPKNVDLNVWNEYKVKIDVKGHVEYFVNNINVHSGFARALNSLSYNIGINSGNAGSGGGKPSAYYDDFVIVQPQGGFSFTEQTNIALNSTVISNIISVSNANVATVISIQNGEYRINGSAWGSFSRAGINGDTVQVRHTAAASPNGTVISTLTIGDVSAQFISTTTTKVTDFIEGVGFIKGLVYDACTGEALDFANFDFIGPDSRSAQSTINGTYAAKLTVGDYIVTVNDSNYQERTLPVSIAKNSTSFADFSMLPTDNDCQGDEATATSFKAIILSGTGPFALSQRNHIWSATQELSDRAYKAFRAQGFAPENIYYLTADKNDLQRTINGKRVIDALASTEALEEAITQWADDVEDVVIFIASHGGNQSFLIDETTFLKAQQLKQWLDILQAKVSGRVTVILDACYSGSFVPALIGNNQKRYIISSTSSDQLAVISNRGTNAFSYYFWDEVVFTGGLSDAYRKARQAVSRNIIKGNPQKAVLDANGDGVESSQDYNAIKDYCFGKCNKLAGLAPEIIKLSPTKDLDTELQVMLSVQVRASNPLAKAWVTIQRPDYKFPQETAISGLPQVKLDCDGDLCQGLYDNFNVNGIYRLSFYVEDSTGEVSLPRTVELKQTGVDTSASSADIIFQPRNGLLSIQDVKVGEQHYWVELHDQGEYKFIVKDFLPLSESVSQQPASYRKGSLTLPRLYYYGANQYFSIDLIDNGSLEFQPDFNSLRELD